MDSGNSGSLQSSSGGEDEFDSRGGGAGVDSSPLSALLRQPPSPSAAAFSLHGAYFGLQEFTSSAPPPPPPQQQQPGGTWSSGSFAGASGLPSSSSSPRVAHQDGGAGARQQQPADTGAVAPQASQGQGPATGAPAPRGSRKRTRASRRAPTTVLTTDTSNFRAMVQEFTGIPSPPFGAGAAGVGIGVGGPAASLRTRFDHIFLPPSSLRGAAGGAADSLPPYLLRPFAHKLPTAPSSAFPPFTATTTSSPSTSSTPSSSNIGVANANAATGTAAAGPSNSNPAASATAAADTFQQLTSSALLRLQQDPSNNYLTFQNLLDSQPSSQSIFGAAGAFAAQASRPHDPSTSPSDYLASAGSGGLGLAHGGLLGGSDGLQHLHHSRSDVHGHGSDELSGVVAAGASGGSCKLNYSQSHPGAGASSSGAGGAEKPPDGGGGGVSGRPGRGEGLDPWICTSE